jgi:DNA-binding response OmpR family regulator
MIVDKDKEFLKWIKGVLTLAGYNIYAYHDENSAVDGAFQIKPDVVLLGFDEIEKSGFFLAHEIRLSSENIPIIAMASFYTDEERTKLMEICNLNSCLLKPFYPLDVIAKIEMSLPAQYVDVTEGDLLGVAKWG